MKDEYEVHPLAGDYPAMPEREYRNLVEGMKANGYDPIFPVVLYEGKILDGKNRLKAAEEAGVDPVFTQFVGGEDDAVNFVVAANEHRRHLPPEWLQARRQERIERVTIARTEGQSLRAIAEQEGVSLATVQSDLESATVQGHTVAPTEGKVKGRDDREYTAPPPKPPLPLCGRCQRTGPVKGCGMCAELRQTSKPKPKPKPDDTAVDAFGTPLPEKCRHAYQDPWIQETIDWLATASATFWGKRMADGISKRKKYLPFFNVKDFVDGCGMAGNTIDQLLEHLKEFRPAGVCPACDGKGCAECKLCGMVPRDVYAKLKGKK